MAIDISKIENLLINEGSNDTPFILTDTEVTTLYKLAISNNPKIKIKGYVNTTTGTILKYQSYQIKKAWSELVVLAQEITTQDWTAQLQSNTMTEREETKLIVTNISIETLEWQIDDVSLSVISGSYGEQDVRDHLHFDNRTGRIYYDLPTSNAGWVANVQMSFWPSYIEEPEPEDYRTVTLTIRAIAVTDVNVTAPSRIDESATISIQVAPYPTNNTKSPDGVKYSLQTQYGILSPSSGTVTSRTEFVYYAPEFKDVPWSEDPEGKFYNHQFTAQFYMFGSTTSSGAKNFQILMKNTAFRVTCDKDSLVEGEQATFDVLGYTWAEVQKTMVVDETKLIGITEEELRNRTMFQTGPYFSMNQPTDNATFSADVKLYIAPPGADPTGDRSFCFNMSLRAIGISSLTLSPQTIGQNIPSVISLTYRPAVHTKGTITYGFTCPGVTISRRDDEHGIYNLFSDEITSEGHDAMAYVYSQYTGTSTPLFSSLNKLYVQDIYFNVKFPDGSQDISLDEGQFTDCVVDILHISELRREVTVTVTSGGSLIDADWVKDRLHFSNDTSTDRIWFDNPKENISWSADLSIRFIARYIPEGQEPPYSQTVTMHFRGKEVTGVEWISEKTNSNSRIAVSPYRKSAYFQLQTLPIDNTKHLTLQGLQDNPFSVGAIGGGLSMNVVSNGRFVAIANTYSNWTVQGFVDVFSNSLEHGTICYNLTGSTTQAETPSTSYLVYPKNLTLYDKIDDEYIELRKIGTVADTYNFKQEEVFIEPPTITRRIGRKVLSAATTIDFDGNMTANTACFSIEIEDKKTVTEHAAYNNILCSHFNAVDSDITISDLPDTIIDNDTDNKVYMRIALSAIGATGTETTEEIKNLIIQYIVNQGTLGTPITMYYLLNMETLTEYENTLYKDNVFFKAPIYHIYTANNPANLAYVEFINNNTIATNRVVFGVNYPMDDDNNKALERLMVDNVRPETTQITQVPYFAGSKTQIDQYTENGTLITDTSGNAEKGEVNIWENFCGKYEEWTDEEWAHVTWNINGETTQEGTPTPTAPIYPTHSKYYTSDHDIVYLDGVTWTGIYYGDKFEYNTQTVRSNIGYYEFTGTEGWGNHSKRANTFTLSIAPAGHTSIYESKGNIICSHIRHVPYSNWHSDDLGNTVSESGGNYYFNFQWDTVFATKEEFTAANNAQLIAAVKTWLAQQATDGTPMRIWYPKATTAVYYDKDYYTYGNVHRKYTISKVVNDDDTEGDPTATNKFNPAFVYNLDQTIPNRFFLSRFIPGWHNNDTTTTISMAKGLRAQQRTINRENVVSSGCYYKNDEGELKQIRPVYYGPLLAYSWLAYITYGSLNLKNSIGLGASKIGAEAQVFADDSGTPLTPGQTYSSLYIINNGYITADTYQNYDFNIIGAASADIAKKPITSYTIRSVDVGPIYTIIDLGNAQRQAATYTATESVDYYSLNSCYSETGYSDSHYLDEDGNQVVSGYGTTARELIYGDTLHPVRCLNVENMWGGGAYTIDGTAFVPDDEDAGIARPLLWDPTDAEQDIDDSTTWDKITDISVVPTTGTSDVGSYIYKDSKCAWVNEPAKDRVPYRSFNVYNRPAEFDNATYGWITGTYNDWSDSSDFQSMCGLGHTNFAYDNAAGYVFVEYLESTGPQYINLGHGFTNTDEIWAKAAILTQQGNYYNQFLRPTTQTSGRYFGFGWQYNTETNFHFAYGTYGFEQTLTSFGVPIDKNWHIWHYINGHFNMEDKGVSIVAPGNWSGETDNLLLFKGQYDTACRVYEVWQKRDGFYLYDLVPCYRKSDKKPGMYDKISGQFFTNANETVSQANCDFILGPEIDTTMYQELSYVETSGTQFVDTGMKFKQIFKFNADFTPAQTSTTTSWIGGNKNITGTCGLNVFVSSDNRLALETASGTTYLSNVDTIMPGNRYAIEIEQTDSLFRVKIGATTTYSSEPITFDTSLNYYLFNVNSNGAADPTKSFKGKMHSIKVTFGTDVARNYIPVYNKELQKYGIYDIAFEKYYGNQGAGNITGPEVLKKVDCLYFNGNQYIDTGWNYKPYSQVDISADLLQWAPSGKNSIIFGNRQTNNMFTYAIANPSGYINADIGTTNRAITAWQTGAYYRYVSSLYADENEYKLTTQWTPTKYTGTIGPIKQPQSCFLGGYRDADGSKGPNTYRHKIYDCAIYEQNVFTPVINMTSSGTQYTDIDYKPTNNTIVEVELASLQDTNNMLFGSYNGSLLTNSYGLYNGASGLKLNYNCDMDAGTAILTTDGKVKVKIDGGKLYINDELRCTAATSTFECVKSIQVYAGNNQTGKLSIYSFKVWEGETLVRDIVPSLRFTDKKICLYDKVSKRVFTNDGTGEFDFKQELPPDVSYAGYMKVEYIQSTNEQCYIDSGFKANNNTKLEMTVMPNATGNAHFYYGCTSVWGGASFGLYDGGTWMNYNSDQNISKSSLLQAGTIHTIVHDKNLLYIDGSLAYTHSAQTFQGARNLSIGSCQPHAGRGTSGMKLYGYKIYDNGNLVIDAIPVYRISDGKAGMVNLIRDSQYVQFFPSAGTSQFTWGGEELGPMEPDLPAAYREIEYLESNGTQYFSAPALQAGDIAKIKTKPRLVSTHVPFIGAANSFEAYFNNNTGYTAAIDLEEGNEITITDGEYSFEYILTVTSTTQTGLTKLFGGPTGNYNGKIYSYSVTRGEDTVVDMRPCVRLADNVAGFYDIKSDTFTPNAGTYQFIEPVPNNGSSEIVTKTCVRHFTPVYSVLHKEYCMYDLINEQLYRVQGNIEGDSLNGPIQKVEYIQNLNGNDPAQFSVWNIDTQVNMEQTSRISVDLDIVRQSPLQHDMCMMFAGSPTSRSDWYLCYSDNTVSGVTLTERTVEESTVTWDFTFTKSTNSSYFNVHIAGYDTNWEGIYNYKRVKIYANDKTTLLRDMIPVRCGTEYGMYDLITEQVFFNSSPRKPQQNHDVRIVGGPDLDDGVPGDPGIKATGGLETLARVYGTL